MQSIIRTRSRLLLVAAGSSLLLALGGVAQGAEVKEVKPAVKAAKKKAATEPVACDAKAAGAPVGNGSGDGANTPTTKKPNPPKCPEKVMNKVATPQ